MTFLNMVIKLASENIYSTVDWIPTGLPSLDKILGGGIPTRRITEVSGPYSVGKTTLALMIIAQAQKMGKPCLWVDQEWAWDGRYAEILGVDPTKLGLVQEEYAEAALDLVEGWAGENENGVIVIDAIGALLPRAEAEKGAEGKTIGGQAGMVAKFCRKIVPKLAINNTALIVLNHEFIDIMSGRVMTSGGKKLEYHKTIWLKLRKISKMVKRADVVVGEAIEAEIRKNKLAGTDRQTCELMMEYGRGFSVEADLLQQLIDSGEVTKVGNTYWRGEVKLGTGLGKAREALKTTQGLD